MSEFHIRKAIFEDLAKIIQLYHDDDIGCGRENISEPLQQSYIQAWEAIERSENNQIFVAQLAEEIIGTFQITVIPHLNRKGTKRMQLESMQIEKDFRGRGYETQIMQFVEKKAKNLGCKMMQVTTDVKRPRAKHFYEKNQFVASHSGMKRFFEDGII